MDSLKLTQVKHFEKYVLDRIKREEEEVVADIREKKKLTEEAETKLKEILDQYLKDFESNG